MESLEKLLEHWKAILTSIGAILLISLQVVNVLLTTLGHETLDSLLDKKTTSIETKADIISKLVDQNGTRIAEIRKELDELEKKYKP